MISLKFKDGLAVQLVDGQFNLEQKQLPNSDLRRGLAALTREAQLTEPQTLSQLLRGAGGAKISPLVTKSLKEHDAEMTRLNLYSTVPLADLSTYFTLYLPEKFGAEASMRLINQLNALNAVELAEAWPKTTVPSTTGTRQPSNTMSTTPDFSAMQSYLKSAAAPNREGINALHAWQFAGGKGQGTKFIDIEYDWNEGHEDLKPKSIFSSPVSGAYTTSQFLPSPAARYATKLHGTAVLSILLGQHNGFGINGIVPHAEWGYGRVTASTTQAAALFNSAFQLAEGDALLLEQQTITDCIPLAPVNCLVASEHTKAVYDNIQSAVAKGITVVEPAGSGGVNMDLYLTRDYSIDPNLGNSKTVRGSGAVMVAARTQNNAYPMYFTNFGKRVDLFAQGENVMTASHSGADSSTPGTQYCNAGGIVSLTLPGTNGNPPAVLNGIAANYFNWPPITGANASNSDNICYSPYFSGTSSAAPIVLGALLSIQGIHKAQYPVGNSLQIANAIRPRHLLPIIKKTGFAATDAAYTSKPIGKGPDLEAAINFYFADQDNDGHSNGKEAAMGWDRSYRLYDSVNQRHFWTTDETERDNLMAELTASSLPKWNCEGLAYKLFGYPEAHNGSTNLGSANPLFRLQNIQTGTRFWTADLNEKNYLMSFPASWRLEGIAGFVSPTSAANLVPLYRLYFPSLFYHFYTTDANEKQYLVNLGFASYEGVTGYVIPVNATTNGGSQCAY